MINLKLEREDINNLKIFLERITLQGVNEATALLKIVQSLNQAKEEEGE